jgi:hypothetical protein
MIPRAGRLMMVCAVLLQYSSTIEQQLQILTCPAEVTGLRKS